MVWLLWSLYAIAIVFLLWVISRKLLRNQDLPGGGKLPPVVSGWLPWVGCAVEFGKAPLDFIISCKKKHGNVFTIHAAGKHMTFLMDINHISTYMSSPALDFQKAVQPFTNKAAGLPPDSFVNHHRAMHDMVKGRLASGKLSDACLCVSRLFHEKLTAYCGDGGDSLLYEFVQKTMFHAVVQNLFGEECIKTAGDVDHFRKTFEQYDLDFEYGTELPELLLPKWAKCKHWLLDHFKKLIAKQCHNKEATHSEADNNLFECLMSTVNSSCAHNYALLLLWATQANAIPAVFWTLAFLHSQPELLASVRQEVDFVFKGKDKGDGLSEDDLRAMPSVYRCVLEGVRIRSPGMITRRVTEPLQIDGFTIPAGHYAMLSPYWMHRNPQAFPDPEHFNPDRWAAADLSKNVFLPGFVAFGGGRYHCPGRWFALMEMQAFVAFVIRHYELQLTTPVPDPSPLHLVGVQQPAKPCTVSYRRRQALR